jgi:hypothetical protein
MKKLLLSSLFFTATTVLMAQLDSSAFNVTPSSPGNPAQFITTPITPSLQFTQDFTLECWVYVPSTPFSGYELFLIESYSSGSSGGYVLRLSQTNKVKGYAMGATQPSIIGNTTVPFNTWTHVATTYNSTSGELKVFLNGVQDGISTPNISIYNNASFLKIGARGDDNAATFALSLDEVRIWNVTKTEAEIASAMNNCLTGNEAGLALYYDFENELSSGIVTDKTANNNDGTYTSNGATYTYGVFDCAVSNLSLNENKTIQLDVFPNPASDLINLSISQPTTISITTSTGQIVRKLELDGNATIDVSTFTTGIYFIQTSEGQTVKFIKQ